MISYLLISLPIVKNIGSGVVSLETIRLSNNFFVQSIEIRFENSTHHRISGGNARMDNVVFSTFMGMEFENPETILLFRIQVTLCIRNN